MPSFLSHPAPALALAILLGRPRYPVSVALAGAACSVLPDADVIGLAFGVPYDSMLGHRGITHSPFFAAAIGAAGALAWRDPRMPRVALGLYLFAATASHALLDALTNGGRGVALLAPFSPTRFFFPFRPIQVSPLSLERFLSERGLLVLASEIVWVWLPSLLLASLLLTVRRAKTA